MKQYKNYIFDLYGTLIDNRTDEGSMTVWRNLAKMYRAYGSDYKPAELKKTYERFVNEELDKLKKAGVSDTPELDLDIVFLRLLHEAPKKHKTVTPIGDEKEWVRVISNMFRVLSLKHIRLFKNTLSTLKELHRRGCKVFLLSNAQATFTMPEIEMTGLLDAFDKIYISSWVLIKKPDPKFMEILLKEQKLRKEECVMVGNDLTSDMEVAAASGVDGILLNTFPYSAKELKNKNIHGFPVIKNIKELLT